jgi:ATP-dependent RNA helicase DDX19/DBP5
VLTRSLPSLSLTHNKKQQDAATAAAAPEDGPPPGFGGNGKDSAKPEAATAAAGAASAGAASAAPPATADGVAAATTTTPGADNDEDEAPPGFPASDADALAAGLAGVGKPSGDEPDEPDLALAGGGGGLREDPAAKISVAHADDAAEHDFAALYRSAATFEELPISQDLLKGIYTEMKFERPSRIQALTLPMILTPDGHGRLRDLIAQAHNGSGKTTCFVLSMLSRVDPAVEATQALCMCPTRELVVQNLSVLRRMAKFTTITSTSTAADDAEPASASAAGGLAGAGGPIRRTNRITEHVVVGTHGRLKTWVTKKLLDIDHVRILVFDEADEMLKGDAFADDTVRLIKTIRRRNADVQLLLFSATFNDQIKSFALKIAPKANQVFVPKEELSLEVIAQYSVRVPSPRDKASVLKNMIFPNCEKLGQTIIFVRTRNEARALHAAMEQEGYRCTSITGDMQMHDRDRVVREFRDGATKILISTDVLSRGFDVSQVTLVVNYDAPVERDQRTPNYETYLHRIGRSGRFGRRGAAFNLVAGEEDARVVDSIARYFARDIPEVAWDDEEAFIEVLRKAGLTDQTA